MPKLIPLPHGRGYCIDLRTPHTDRIAVRASKIWFGERLVDEVLTHKHRGHVSAGNIKSDIFEYNRIYTPKLKHDSYSAVLASVRKDFVPVEPRIPWTLGAAQIRIPGAKSPGLPWRERGFNTKLQVLEDPAAFHRFTKSGHSLAEAWRLRCRTQWSSFVHRSQTVQLIRSGKLGATRCPS